MLYTVLDYIMLIAECTMSFQLYQWQLQAKCKGRKQYVPLLGLLIFYFSRGYLLGFENPLLEMVLNILAYILDVFVIALFYKGGMIRKVIVFALNNLVVFVTELLAVVTAMVLLGESLGYVQEQRHLVISFSCIMYPAVTAFLFWFLKDKRKMFALPSYNRFPLVCIFLMNILLIIASSWVWHFSEELNMSNEDVLMLVMVIVFFVLLFSFVIFLNMLRKSEEQAELKLRLQQSEMQNQLNEEISVITDKLRSLRHDMNNHIDIIKGYAQLQAYDKLNEYLNSITVDIEQANQYVVIEPPALSILLNNKITKAQSIGIDLNMEIHIAGLQMDERDIVTLFGNMLENAIEAASKATEKKISFEIHMSENMYQIQCSNTYFLVPQRKGNVFVTTKKDVAIHGIGVKNMEAIVEQYNGMIEFYIGEEFVVNIRIPVCDK